MGKMQRVVLEQVFREQNQVVDKIAKEGTKMMNFGNTNLFVLPPYPFYPLFVIEQVDADTKGHTNVRKVRTKFLNSLSRDVA